eukprot:scaffold434_cov186-Pinguiococcus_pyrenoidosus.AAC.51
MKNAMPTGNPSSITISWKAEATVERAYLKRIRQENQDREDHQTQLREDLEQGIRPKTRELKHFSTRSTTALKNDAARREPLTFVHSDLLL